MLENKISKVYYARVRGDFSKCPGMVDNQVSVKNMIFCVSNIDAFWDCAEAADLKFEHREAAKEAFTRFKFKYYDPKSDMSVIKCYPRTGRTHQIRVHLKHLKFPIANDQMYGTSLGDRLIINDGGKPLKEENFANAY